jgi:hypothetical protein
MSDLSRNSFPMHYPIIVGGIWVNLQIFVVFSRLPRGLDQLQNEATSYFMPVATLELSFFLPPLEVGH